MVESSALRVFVAISLDARLKATIRELQEGLQTLLELKPVRWVRSEQLHFTLKFCGNVPSDNIPMLTNALRSSCQGFTLFELSLNGIGCFPSFQRPNVIWLGVGGDLAILANLQKQVKEQTKAFGSHVEEREFRPHLTIGRVKASPRDARQVGRVIRNQQVGELGRWDIREVEIIQSTLLPEGSSYRRLASFLLPET